ncbi:hypothetical protein [Chromobacterium haemolyticum]|uniref:hypothetical protein n=1 Tax=Chromobacterium haemolyticum TaxID=394935 RepID=UPI00112FEBE8|nr:hypothetical protein [Chromobacterium haemolyticum]
MKFIGIVRVVLNDCWLLARLVFNSLENERAIDVKQRGVYVKDEDAGFIPNYKVMKQVALTKRLGKFYRVFIFISPVLIVLLWPFHWFLGVLGGAFKRDVFSGVKRYIVVTPSRGGMSLINSAICFDIDAQDAAISEQELSCYKLGRTIGLVEVFLSIVTHFLFLYFIFTSSRGIRKDMMLHARDSFSLCMLANSKSLRQSTVLTDDHYQRWSYILSHLISDFRIVQHGFLDIDLVLPNPYGKVSLLYLRDHRFLEDFQKFYQVLLWRLFVVEQVFVKTNFPEKSIFLASSFPAIDSEIELLTMLKERCSIPIFVKFHPAHLYDGRKKKLANLADGVFEGEGNPVCGAFVSYNSFMEFDYSSHGVATVSIVRSGSVNRACSDLLNHIQEIDLVLAK